MILVAAATDLFKVIMNLVISHPSENYVTWTQFFSPKISAFCLLFLTNFRYPYTIWYLD